MFRWGVVQIWSHCSEPKLNEMTVLWQFSMKLEAGAQCLFFFGVQKIKSPRSTQNMQVRLFYDGLAQKSGKGNKISTCPKSNSHSVLLFCFQGPQNLNPKWALNTQGSACSRNQTWVSHMTANGLTQWDIHPSCQLSAEVCKYLKHT